MLPVRSVPLPLSFSLSLSLLLPSSRPCGNIFAAFHLSLSPLRYLPMALQFRRARNMKYRAASAISTAYAGWNPYRVAGGNARHAREMQGKREGETRVNRNVAAWAARLSARGEIYASERAHRGARGPHAREGVGRGMGGGGMERPCSFSARRSRNRNYAIGRLRRPRVAHFRYRANVEGGRGSRGARAGRGGGGWRRKRRVIGVCARIRARVSLIARIDRS